MKKQGKILLTDIRADRNREESLIQFQKLLATAFTKYAAIKLSLNYFTMTEMVEDMEADRKAEVQEYILGIRNALKQTVLSEGSVSQAVTEEISGIRDRITYKMKILTAYTDALEVYEYILNRKEAEVKGTAEDFIDTDALAGEMFRYVFSDQDKLLINSKIQSFVAQLPVRMTKNRFYDIIANTLSIYKGGEKAAVNDFLDSLFSAALIDVPEGFETEYRDLYDIYQTLRQADYKNLTLEEYSRLTGLLEAASVIINNAVTDYLMLQEIVNDVLILLYTGNLVDSAYLDRKYQAAITILNGILDAEDIYAASCDFDSLFEELLGAQEEAYEELSFLEANLQELKDTYEAVYPGTISDGFAQLMKADRLTSSSLFMDVDRDFTVVEEAADEAFINDRRDYAVERFGEKLRDCSKLEQRSIMAKILAMLPVFFNSQQEIKDYFEYTLSRCGDDSELTACERIIREMMEENMDA